MVIAATSATTGARQPQCFELRQRNTTENSAQNGGTVEEDDSYSANVLLVEKNA